MEYLFLRRRKTIVPSERQKALLFRAAEKEWEARFASIGQHTETAGRKIDCSIYKSILYQLELKQVFLDAGLSLKKLSVLVETNQTYLSNVVNKYFGCNLKELINVYRVEYAKELLRSGKYSLDEIPRRSGFASKSAYYAAFGKHTGGRPMQYLAHEWHNKEGVNDNRLNQNNKVLL